MRKLRRITVFLAALWMVLSTFILPRAAYAYEPDFSVNANAVYMVNLDENKVLYEKNAHERVYPASLTMLMTAILTMENVKDLDNTMIPLKPYIEDTIYRAGQELGGVTLAGILRNETLSAHALLYAVMLPSGNEAAMMLADYVGDGSVDYFVEMMNEKAKEIGAVDTHFSNSNGLHDPNNYTTAYDMYLITQYAMGIPGFTEIANTTSYDGGPTEKHDHLYWNTGNKLMVQGSSYYYAPVKGIKAGSSMEAGRCLISTASKNGYNYLLVVMGAPVTDSEGKTYEENFAFTETKRLYEWAFDSFSTKTLIEKGEGVGEVPLRLGKNGKDHLLLMSGERFTSLLPAEIEATSVTYELELPKVVMAPIERGQQVGTIQLMLAEEVVGTVPAVAAEKVDTSLLAVVLDRAHRLIRPYWVKFVLIYVFLLAVVYVAITSLRNHNKRRYAAVKRSRNL